MGVGKRREVNIKTPAPFKRRVSGVAKEINARASIRGNTVCTLLACQCHPYIESLLKICSFIQQSLLSTLHSESQNLSIQQSLFQCIQSLAGTS